MLDAAEPRVAQTIDQPRYATLGLLDRIQGPPQGLSSGVRPLPALAADLACSAPLEAIAAHSTGRAADTTLGFDAARCAIAASGQMGWVRPD